MAAQGKDIYAEPSEVVRRFIAEMNAWELQTIENFKKMMPEDHQEFSRDAQRRLDEVFGRWCTPKERKYGRLGSFQEPPEYQPDHEEILETAIESKSRASVYTQRHSGFCHHRRYVLLHKQGGWLLDNVKWQHRSDGKWSNGIL